MKRSCFIGILVLVAGSVFAQTSPDNGWKNKMLYVSAQAGLGPIFGQDGTVLGGNLNPVQVDWQITNFLSLGTGMGFYFAPETKYTALKQTDPASGEMETYNGMETHIVFPLLLEATFRPSVFSIELGGGVYVAPVVMNTTVERTNDNGYTISEGYGKSLFSTNRNNPFGFIVSGSFGVKAGKGILFLDVKYLQDFAKTTVKFKPENKELGSHLWNILAINLGFKYGLF